MGNLQHQLSQQQNVLSAIRETQDDQAGLDERRHSLVLAAREYGASWAAIGNALGTSKQAAWIRYGEREGDE